MRWQAFSHEAEKLLAVLESVRPHCAIFDRSTLEADSVRSQLVSSNDVIRTLPRDVQINIQGRPFALSYLPERRVPEDTGRAVYTGHLPITTAYLTSQCQPVRHRREKFATTNIEVNESKDQMKERLSRG